MESAPIFCARCNAVLEPGAGTFYQVNIEAFADPAPPNVADEHLDAEAIRRQLAGLYQHLEGTSAQEAMDQVYRRLVLYLCGTCYRHWIENPTR